MKYINSILFILALAACSPEIRVYLDHDPDYHVRNFSTFDWGQKAAIDMIAQEQTEEIINRAVGKIFRHFPASTKGQEPVASTFQRF